MAKITKEVCGCTHEWITGVTTCHGANTTQCPSCGMYPWLIEEEEECTIVHGELRPFTYHVIRVDAVQPLDEEKVQVGGLYRYYDLNDSDNRIMVVYDYITDEGHVLFYPELTVVAYEEKA